MHFSYIVIHNFSSALFSIKQVIYLHNVWLKFTSHLFRSCITIWAIIFTIISTLNYGTTLYCSVNYRWHFLTILSFTWYLLWAYHKCRMTFIGLLTCTLWVHVPIWDILWYHYFFCTPIPAGSRCALAPSPSSLLHPTDQCGNSALTQLP